MATQAYRLELKWESVCRYIINADKCWHVADVYPRNAKTIEEAFSPIGKRVVAGAAIVYPEFNLLWLDDSPAAGAEEMSVETFEKTFTSLPRWESTRYAVMYGINDRDDDGRILTYAALLCDCQTGLGIRRRPRTRARDSATASRYRVARERRTVQTHVTACSPFLGRVALSECLISRMIRVVGAQWQNAPSGSKTSPGSASSLSAAMRAVVSAQEVRGSGSNNRVVVTE